MFGKFERSSYALTASRDDLKCGAVGGGGCIGTLTERETEPPYCEVFEVNRVYQFSSNREDDVAYVLLTSVFCPAEYSRLQVTSVKEYPIGTSSGNTIYTIFFIR